MGKGGGLWPPLLLPYVSRKRDCNHLSYVRLLSFLPMMFTCLEINKSDYFACSSVCPYVHKTPCFNDRRKDRGTDKVICRGCVAL